MHAATDRLLRHFLETVEPTVPLVALWAHGSLATDDYQPGRSDLDLIAVVAEPVTMEQWRRLKAAHRAIDLPLADKLHCSYLARQELADLAAEHVTWAHERIFRRPVTPVTRRELHTKALHLYGPPPAELLPPVSDAELAEFVRADLRDFWLVMTRGRRRWLRDVWVDLGTVTVARAAVTLADGRLISKREALDLLPGLGAPEIVVADVRARRYGTPRPGLSRFRRAKLARAFIRSAIRKILT
ncbi:nucleotidyltransferase domain-containing protein [Actinomadura sp. ATCC 31491]|uniref:Nucleotidyltransferase domain-containing protein n=1 Tax=Actinomadura luzonensis TaxID=2805427 RepID=A0ABT0FRB4_9ACTN|nr:nucleotidyltransferase domain-containing protein [Actinomadura luzonensis]MCK2214872.1 nucleotidyltransferase domain-containing protein [Actinomadura luzonensis]